MISQSIDNQPAIVVQHVWPGSPAAAAGLRRNDVLLSIDGVEGAVSSAEVAKGFIYGTAGSAISVKVRRETEVLDVGPIERGTWATLDQMDHNLSAMRHLVAENKIPGLSEICTNLIQMRQTLEEERQVFQDEVARMSSLTVQNANHAKQLENRLVEMAESTSKVAECAALIDARAGHADFASRQKATTQQFSKSAAEAKKTVDSVISRIEGGVGPEQIATAKAELSKVKTQIDSLHHLHTKCSQQALVVAEPVSNLRRLASAIVDGQAGDQPAIGSESPVLSLIDGWKKCGSGQSSGPFWYNTNSKEIRLSAPNGMGHDSESVGSRRRGVDMVVCAGQELVAKRASFGPVRDISGVAVRAEPFLADSELDNADRIKGNIALIGRGKCSFVSKAKRAISAGATAVVIVNTDDKTCEVVGESAAVRVPILSIGRKSAELIRDGHDVSLVFDAGKEQRGELAASGAGTSSPRLEGAPPPFPPLLHKQRKHLRPEQQSLGLLSTHPEREVVARASPSPVLVDQQQPAAAYPPAASRVGLVSKHMSHSLGSASLCSQDGTVVMNGERTASVPKKKPPPAASPTDASNDPDRVEAARALVSPQGSATPRGGGATPRRISILRDQEGARGGKEEAGLGLERRARGGVLVSPLLRPLQDGEGGWTGSEWSIKSQGSVRGKHAQMKIKLYRMAVEAVGVLKLPPGWDMRMSRTYKQVFFYNKQTGERRWSRPPALNATNGSIVGVPESQVSERGEGELLPFSRAASAVENSPAPEGRGRDEEPEPSFLRLSSSGRGGPIGLANGGVSPPVGAVVSHVVVIPPWPEELRSAMGTMARILMGGRQMVCTRAEFGMQANPSKSTGVVTGRIERAQPWLANAELQNAEAMRGCIAVIGRGGCPFTDKARAVEQAGAVAAVIVNHADFLFNVLGEASEVTIPVVSVTKSDGEALQNGALVAVQWGETPDNCIEEEPELETPRPTPWSFRMTSKVVHNGSAVDDEEHPPSVC